MYITLHSGKEIDIPECTDAVEYCDECPWYMDDCDGKKFREEPEIKRNTIKVNWISEENPEYENDYIVTVLEPMMFSSNGGSSYVKTLAVSHYNPDEGWDRSIVAWTYDWIELY